MVFVVSYSTSNPSQYLVTIIYIEIATEAPLQGFIMTLMFLQCRTIDNCAVTGNKLPNKAASD